MNIVVDYSRYIKQREENLFLFLQQCPLSSVLVWGGAGWGTVRVEERESGVQAGLVSDQ